MIVNNLNPVIAEFFGLQIRWYGIVYVLAFITLYIYLKVLAKRNTIDNFKEEHIEEFLIGSIISMIIGARLFHVFVYYPAYYFQNPLEIVMIWKGGLSFHGALILIGLWIFYFSRKKEIHFLSFTDWLVIPAAIFLALGRITNYVNGELVGKVTNVSWGVYFNNSGYDGFRHPVQIYDSIKNVLLFGILIGIRSIQNHFFRKAAPGLLTAIFLIGYGSVRFFIEFLQEGIVVILGLKMGQILSVAMTLFGIYLIYIYMQTKRKIQKAHYGHSVARKNLKQNSSSKSKNKTSEK